MVDDGTNNTTRRNSVLHLNDERYTHFEFQFLLNDTTNDGVVMLLLSWGSSEILSQWLKS